MIVPYWKNTLFFIAFNFFRKFLKIFSVFSSVYNYLIRIVDMKYWKQFFCQYSNDKILEEIPSQYHEVQQTSNLVMQNKVLNHLQKKTQIQEVGKRTTCKNKLFFVFLFLALIFLVTFQQIKMLLQKNVQQFKQSKLINPQIHTTIETFTKNSTKFQFTLQQWEFFRAGADHSVFINTNKSSPYHEKVLIFSKSNKQQLIDEQFSKKFTQQLSQNILMNWIPKKINLQINSTQDLSKVKQWYEKKNIEKGVYSNFIITQNLINREKYNLIVQFKPRNPYPHIYSDKTVQQAAVEAGISEHEAIKILKNSPPNEKTRWFKWSILKNASIEGNPLNIFNIEKDQIPNYTKTRYFKIIPQGLNHSLINLQIQKLLNTEYQVVFNQLLKLMKIYHKPFQLAWPNNIDIKEQYMKTLPNVFMPKDVQIDREKIRKQMIKETCVSNEDLKLEEYWKNIYMLDVGFCFSDLSILLKLKVGYDSKILKHDLSLLDTQLKPVLHLRNLIHNSKKALQSYFSYKLKNMN